MHVCKLETLDEAYKLAKKNNGAPGIDEVTFEQIEKHGRIKFLAQLKEELEKAKEKTRQELYTKLEYARFADGLVMLVNWYPSNKWLVEAVKCRTKEEVAMLQVELNQKISRLVDLTKGESFTFLGYDFRRIRSSNVNCRWRSLYTPQLQKRKKFLDELQRVFASYQSRPIREMIEIINPKLRGHCNYFRFGHAARHFSYICWWVSRKIRRHLQRARGNSGFGWKKWSAAFIYGELGLFYDYGLKKYQPAANPAR